MRRPIGPVAPSWPGASLKLNEVRRPKVSLAEAFPLGFEQRVLRDTPREAEETRVRDHAMRWAQASASHGPAPLKHLEHLEHAEAAHLAKALEEALHLTHVRAVRENDAARPQRAPHRLDRLPWLGQVKKHPVHIPLVNAQVDVRKLELEVRRHRAQGVGDRS